MIRLNGRYTNSGNKRRISATAVSGVLTLTLVFTAISSPVIAPAQADDRASAVVVTQVAQRYYGPTLNEPGAGFVGGLKSLYGAGDHTNKKDNTNKSLPTLLWERAALAADMMLGRLDAALFVEEAVKQVEKPLQETCDEKRKAVDENTISEADDKDGKSKSHKKKRVKRGFFAF